MPFVTVNKVVKRQGPNWECKECKRMLHSSWFPLISVEVAGLRQWREEFRLERRSEVCQLCLDPKVEARVEQSEARRQERKEARRQYLAELWGRYTLYEVDRSKRRTLAVARATPIWVREADILAKYEAAKAMTAATGRQYHVDHIVPVRSDVVCGLHVPWNLRVIRAEVNMRKGNKLVDRLAIAR